MKPHSTVCLLLLACSLAACRGEKAAPVAAQEEEKVDGLNAGKWDVRSRMASMDMAQVEGAGEERAEEMMREERSTSACLEFSERTKPPISLFYSSAESCSYGDFSMAKGRISGTMSCSSDGNGPSRFSGYYDSKSFSVTVTKELSGADGMASERSYTTSGKHKGNC